MRSLNHSVLRKMRGESSRDDGNSDGRRNGASGPDAPREASLLLNIEDVARLLKVSVRSVCRLRSAGHLPPAIEVLGSIRWRRADIEGWVAAGCPSQNNHR